MIVEVVVAAALFSTAVFALSRLAQTTAKLSVQANEKLSGQIVGENLLARLHATPFDEISAVAKELQARDSERTSNVVKITTKLLSVRGQQVMHIVIDISSSDAKNAQPSDELVPSGMSTIKLYDWIVENADESASVTEDAQSEDVQSEDSQAKDSQAAGSKPDEEKADE
ncbi:hypothetical protein [Stieleria marina]